VTKFPFQTSREISLLNSKAKEAVAKVGGRVAMAKVGGKVAMAPMAKAGGKVAEVAVNAYPCAVVMPSYFMRSVTAMAKVGGKLAMAAMAKVGGKVAMAAMEKVGAKVVMAAVAKVAMAMAKQVATLAPAKVVVKELRYMEIFRHFLPNSLRVLRQLLLMSSTLFPELCNFHMGPTYRYVVATGT